MFRRKKLACAGTIENGKGEARRGEATFAARYALFNYRQLEHKRMRLIALLKIRYVSSNRTRQ